VIGSAPEEGHEDRDSWVATYAKFIPELGLRLEGGLLAPSVGVGLGVVHELMEAEVEEVAGPKGRWNPDRVAVRHGHEDGSLTLGGRRVQVRRPRMRTADGERELPVATYAYFADRDPLTRAVMDRMLAGVSTRKFARVGEPVGTAVEATSSATSKTTVSDMFIERTRTALGELMSRRLDDVRLAVMMLDGLEIADRTHVVALHGVVEMTEQAQKALAEGGETRWEDHYFRTAPRLETGDPRYQWVNQSLFVAQGRVYPGVGVQYRDRVT
jgi:transposase-like protein